MTWVIGISMLLVGVFLGAALNRMQSVELTVGNIHIKAANAKEAQIVLSSVSNFHQSGIQTHVLAGSDPVTPEVVKVITEGVKKALYEDIKKAGPKVGLQ